MIIETKRLRLREFQLADWPDVYAYQSDPRYQRFYPPKKRTPAQAQSFVRMFLVQQKAQPRSKYQLAITLKTDDRLIGNCGLRLEAADGDQADIGYELSPAHWGKGYATEAAGAMLCLGFEQFGLQRIWANCIAENHGSVRVLEKLGMQLESRLKENEFFRGRWWDTLVYGVLRSDWKKEPKSERVYKLINL